MGIDEVLRKATETCLIPGIAALAAAACCCPPYHFPFPTCGHLIKAESSYEQYRWNGGRRYDFKVYNEAGTQKIEPSVTPHRLSTELHLLINDTLTC